MLLWAKVRARKKARSRLTASPRALATESGGPSNRPARKPVRPTERGRRQGIPAPAAHGSGDSFLPRFSPAATRTPAATPGGAFDQRRLGQQPRAQQPAAGAWDK